MHCRILLVINILTFSYNFHTYAIIFRQKLPLYAAIGQDIVNITRIFKKSALYPPVAVSIFQGYN